MFPSHCKVQQNVMLAVFLGFILMIIPSHLLAGKKGSDKIPSATHWWDVAPEEEKPSPYYDSILYSEIGPKLREIQLNSNRADVQVIGQSAGGRNLFLVTISAIGTSDL